MTTLQKYSTVMTLGGVGLLTTVGSYLFSKNFINGKTTGVIVNMFQDNISQDSSKFFYLGIFLLMVMLSHYINLISDEIFLKETQEKQYIEGGIKLSIYVSLLYFIFDGQELFKTNKIYFYVLTGIFAFLHPLFEKLTKTKDAYNSINLVGESINLKNPKMLILLGTFVLTIIYALINRNFEISSSSFFGSGKYMFVFTAILSYFTYGVFKGRRVTYWFYAFLLNILINPNYSITNTMINTFFLSYMIHGMRKTNYEFYLRDVASKDEEETPEVEEEEETA